MPENCSVNCPYLERFKSLEKDYETLYKEKTEAHKEIYNKLDSLKENFAIANTQLGTLINQVAQMSKDIAVLKDKPAKKWESLVSVVSSSAVSGIVGILIGMVMKG